MDNEINENICQNELIIHLDSLLNDLNKAGLTIGNVQNVIMITISLMSVKEKERLTKKAARQRVYRQKYLDKEKSRQLKYYLNNKDILNEKGRERDRLYYINNKMKRLEYAKKYGKNNRKKINKSQTERLHNNIHARLASNLRSRLINVIDGRTKAGSSVRDLGCSVEELKIHLEKQFTAGMSWDNYGIHYTKDDAGNIIEVKSWHIDHIKPLASFDLTDREQFLQACNYKNLQPLWAVDNMRKGDKII